MGSRSRLFTFIERSVEFFSSNYRRSTRFNERVNVWSIISSAMENVGYSDQLERIGERVCNEISIEKRRATRSSSFGSVYAGALQFRGKNTLIGRAYFLAGAWSSTSLDRFEQQRLQKLSRDACSTMRSRVRDPFPFHRNGSHGHLPPFDVAQLRGKRERNGTSESVARPRTDSANASGVLGFRGRTSRPKRGFVESGGVAIGKSRRVECTASSLERTVYSVELNF